MVGRRAVEKVESSTVFELILRDGKEFAQLAEGMDEGQGSL